MTKILRLAAVKEITGLSRSTIYSFIGKGHFPKQISLGKNSRGWLEDEVLAWVKSRADMREEQSPSFAAQSNAA